MDPAKRDQSRKCAYHKEHDHTTEKCRSLHYLVKKLIRVGHLKQHIRSEEKNGETSRNPTTMVPTTSAVLRVVIKYIHGGPIDKEYNSKQNNHISPIDSNRVLKPHQDVLILTLGINDFDVRQILVDLGSSIDFL